MADFIDTIDPGGAAARAAAKQKVLLDAEVLEQARTQKKLDQSRGEREKDLAAGVARGKEIFADGSLGRLAEGYSNEEMNAMRDNNLGTINAGGKANLRALRIQQAAQGVRGGQATAQVARAKADQQGQLIGSERDLFLKNIDARRDSQKYNIDQVGREKQAQLTTELGYGALGSADRGAVMQTIVGEKQAEASKNAGNGGGKK